MFSYYGSKSKVVDYYPPPKHGLIIEPFAGSARYALKYWDRDVILNDKYDVVVRIWKWLQQCSPGDILGLPDLKQGDRIDREKFDCIEMAWLLGFMINSGVSTPMLTMSKWGEKNFRRSRQIILENLHKIKHWKIVEGDFRDLPDENATWFVDPPYIHAGYKYRHNSKQIDFNELGNWCQSRKGQVIVCENANAEWLPFVPLKEMNGITGDSKPEGIWSNEPTNYDNVQLAMF